MSKKPVRRSYPLNREDLAKAKATEPQVLHFVKNHIVSPREAAVYLNRK